MRWWGVVPTQHVHRQHGPLGRILACVWVIGLAICCDKAMATLATLFGSQYQGASCAQTIVPAVFQ